MCVHAQAGVFKDLSMGGGSGGRGGMYPLWIKRDFCVLQIFDLWRIGQFKAGPSS